MQSNAIAQPDKNIAAFIQSNYHLCIQSAIINQFNASTVTIWSTMIKKLNTMLLHYTKKRTTKQDDMYATFIVNILRSWLSTAASMATMLEDSEDSSYDFGWGSAGFLEILNFIFKDPPKPEKTSESVENPPNNSTWDFLKQLVSVSKIDNIKHQINSTWKSMSHEESDPKKKKPEKLFDFLRFFETVKPASTTYLQQPTGTPTRSVKNSYEFHPVVDSSIKNQSHLVYSFQ